MVQGNQQTVISALNSTVDGQFSVKIRTSMTGSVGTADNRGSASNLSVTIRDDNAGGSGQGQADAANVSGGGEGDQPSMVVTGQDNSVSPAPSAPSTVPTPNLPKIFPLTKITLIFK